MRGLSRAIKSRLRAWAQLGRSGGGEAMKESQFWALVKGKLPGHVERVENALTRGTPDVNMCHEGSELWLELKVLDAKGHCELRPEQILWHRKRQESGGRVFVLARNENVLKVLQIQREMDLFEVWSCTKPFDWENMNNLLFNVPPFCTEYVVRHAQVGGKQ